MRYPSAIESPALTTPSRNPPSGSYLWYFKSDGQLYRKDSAGTETLAITPATGALTHHASRQCTSAQNFATSNQADAVLWNTASVLDGITYNTGTGVFTVPAAGRYSVNTALLFTASSNTGIRSVRIAINGSINRIVNIAPHNTTGNQVVVTASATYKLAASDTITIFGLQSSGGALALINAATANYVDISYVGPAA